MNVWIPVTSIGNRAVSTSSIPFRLLSRTLTVCLDPIFVLAKDRFATKHLVTVGKTFVIRFRPTGSCAHSQEHKFLHAYIQGFGDTHEPANFWLRIDYPAICACPLSGSKHVDVLLDRLKSPNTPIRVFFKWQTSVIFLRFSRLSVRLIKHVDNVFRNIIPQTWHFRSGKISPTVLARTYSLRCNNSVVKFLFFWLSQWCAG